jgi:natural resistance-associated macrophage protein
MLDKIKHQGSTLLAFMGPGVIASIAFIDPGNIEADLQIGAKTGYQLLYVLLLATLIATLLQTLSARLGVVTGQHLASISASQYPYSIRILLWLIIEFALIGQDMQVVIGTSIALSLLFHISLPLGVFLGAVGAYMLLLLDCWGPRVTEGIFQALVGLMGFAFSILFWLVGVPRWEVVKGMFLPQFSGGDVFASAALLGSLVMPHNLFLHSALVATRKIGIEGNIERLDSSNGGGNGHCSSDNVTTIDEEQQQQDCQQEQLVESKKQRHIFYYNLETILAFSTALSINTAIISIFAYGFYGKQVELGLENAGHYLGNEFGRVMKVIWGLGLLAAGCTATMSGALAGQFIMTGFLGLTSISPLKRALCTRAVALAPTLLVAIAATSSSSIDASISSSSSSYSFFSSSLFHTQHHQHPLDVLNQAINVAQSLALPFALIPLLKFTSSIHIMGTHSLCNSNSISIASWLVAGVILVVNVEAVYVGTLLTVLPLPVIIVVSAAYFGFIAYLVLHTMKPMNINNGGRSEEEDDGENNTATITPLLA